MIRRRPLRATLATLIAGLILAMDAGLVPLLAAGAGRNPSLTLDANAVGALILGLAYTVVGWIVLRRQPGQRLGWVFLAIGLFESLADVSAAYAGDAYALGNGSWPLAAEMSWVQAWVWMPGFTLFSTISILLFPDGRLPSRRWSIAGWLAVAGLVLGVPLAAASWRYRGPALMSAGQAIPPDDQLLSMALQIQLISAIVLTVAAILSVAGMIARFRRSSGVVRQQLKWFTWSAVVEVVLLILWENLPLDRMAGIAFAAVLTPILPVVTALAILRYRLFDIDRILSRTVAYGLVTAVLLIVFGSVNLGLQAILASLVPTDTVAVAASTLVAFVLFQPLRRRVQAIVDRRFDRSAVDAGRSIDLLTERLRDAVELESIRADVVRTVDATIRPRTTALWLRRNETRTHEA